MVGLRAGFGPTGDHRIGNSESHSAIIRPANVLIIVVQFRIRGLATGINYGKGLAEDTSQLLPDFIADAKALADGIQTGEDD